MTAEIQLIEEFIKLHTKLHEDLSRLEKIKDKDKYIKDIVRKNQLFHSPMINELPGMVYYCRNDSNWTMEFVSKGCFQLTGYRPEDLILNNKISYEELIYPEDRKIVRDDVKKAIKKLKQFHLEYRIITAENKIKWVSEVGKFLPLPYGNLQMLEGFIIDITAGKQVEEKLRDSEEFNKIILNNSPSPIYVMNQDKSMKYINPAFEKLTGFSSKEIIDGKPPRPYWIKGMENIYHSNLGQALNKGIDKLELPFINKKGQKFWVEAALRPIRSKGEIKYFMGSFVDITERKKAYEELEKILNDTITTLATIVETRDPYTAGHQKRVTILAIKISKKLKLSDEKIKFIRTAAAIHDIGKINIPPSILSKPGKLTDIEFKLVRTHPQVGFDIIKKINFHYPIDRIILQHHEREDGSGYPSSLKSKDITLEAKIIGIADVVEAMSSHRPYRPALGIKMAIDEIRKNKGKLYNPKIAEACLKVITNKEFSFDD